MGHQAEAFSSRGIVEATERLYRSLFAAAVAFAIATSIWGMAIAPFNDFHRHTIRSLLLGLLLLVPTGVIARRRQAAFEVLRRHPVSLLLVVAASLTVIWLDGGWRSSFYLASYSAIAFAAVAAGLRWSLFCGGLLAFGYVLGLALNSYSWSDLQNLHDADSVVANTGGYLIAGFFFAAPVGWLAGYVARINQIAGSGAEVTNRAEEVQARFRTADLSAREIEVVHLVAAGETNQQIANRLYLSPRTVQSHVESAMRKAEARNRTELAVLAVREGLVSSR